MGRNALVRVLLLLPLLTRRRLEAFFFPVVVLTMLMTMLDDIYAILIFNLTILYVVHTYIPYQPLFSLVFFMFTKRKCNQRLSVIRFEIIRACWLYCEIWISLQVRKQDFSRKKTCFRTSLESCMAISIHGSLFDLLSVHQKESHWEIQGNALRVPFLSFMRLRLRDDLFFKIFSSEIANYDVADVHTV